MNGHQKMNGYHQNVSGGWEEIAQAFSPKLGGWARARGCHEGLEGAFHRKWAEKKLGGVYHIWGILWGKPTNLWTYNIYTDMNDFKWVEWDFTSNRRWLYGFTFNLTGNMFFYQPE
jgi:hypothetical protein